MGRSITKGPQWRASRLRRVLSKHLLQQLKTNTKNTPELTGLYMRL